MNELIPIIENNGKKAVNARDLHEYLESKQQFSDWIKNRIDKYDMVEGQDYETVYFDYFGNQLNTSLHKNMKSENQHVAKIEYALTLSAAKELSMVEGNAKGKTARKYFIACEEKLVRATLTPKTPNEMFMMQAHINIETEKRIERIEEDTEELKRGLSMIREEQEQARFVLNYLPLSDEQVPEMDLRMAIVSLANKYQKAVQIGHDEVWNAIYSKLYYTSRVSIKSCKREKGETWLDVAERKGHLGKIYAIVSELVKSL